MDLSALLARIDARLAELRLSERRACLDCGLKADCIRTMRRGHPPKLGKLRLLSERMGVELEYFTEVTPDYRVDETASPARSEPPSAGHAGLQETGPTWLSRPAFAASKAGTQRPGEPSSREPSSREPPSREPPAGYVFVSGFGSDTSRQGSIEAVEPMLLPERLIRQELAGEPEDFLAARIEGPSMSPILESGDMILIDRRRTMPLQPAIFALDEGVGATVKWVEFVPHSDPPSFRIRAENARFEAYASPADNARIIGRVVWFARRI